MCTLFDLMYLVYILGPRAYTYAVCLVSVFMEIFLWAVKFPTAVLFTSRLYV